MTVTRDPQASSPPQVSGLSAGQSARQSVQQTFTDAQRGEWLLGFLTGFMQEPSAPSPPLQSAPLAPALSVRRPARDPTKQSLLTARVSAVAPWRTQQGLGYQTVTLETVGLNLEPEPGDSLELFPANSPDDVREVLRLLDLNPQTRVRYWGSQLPLWQLLLERVDLGCCAPELCAVLLQYAQSRDEHLTLEALQHDLAYQPRSVLALLRRYPKLRPPAELVFEAMTPLTSSRVPIASERSESGSLSFVTAIDGAPSDPAMLPASLARRCRVGEWLSFVHAPRNLPFAGLEPDEPLIGCFDALGSAAVRSLILQRKHTAARGRNWLIALNAWTPVAPLAKEAAGWVEEGFCHYYQLVELTREHSLTVFEPLVESLWRWLVDRSVLVVSIVNPQVRSQFLRTLTELLAVRLHLSEAAAASELEQWSSSGRLRLLTFAVDAVPIAPTEPVVESHGSVELIP